MPLDERPCNAKFPRLVAASGRDVDLIEPPARLLGSKKQPADTAGLANFLVAHARDVDAAVISLDMLVYGGLIPSRIHQSDVDLLVARLDAVRQARRQNPSIRIYGFSTVMRAPMYDSSEEEPDYYADYGADLFWRRALMDKREREGLSDSEAARLEAIEVPGAVIADYEQRRDRNLAVNIAALDLVRSGDIDYLVFPQDDSNPYGYTAIAQRALAKAIASSGVRNRVAVYPGSDEVALTLLSRAVCRARGVTPSVCVHYASALGPTIVPSYEDRPMMESLKSHVMAAGARFADTWERPDLELMINAPGTRMQEAQFATANRDITYDTYRNLPQFVETIDRFISAGRAVAVCDSAYANGGDPQLVHMLDERGLLAGLCSYAGWNTNCNTLGTTLAQALVGARDDTKTQTNLAYRIIEDVLYQSDVRWWLDEQIAAHSGSYTDVSACLDWVCGAARERLQHSYDALRLADAVPVDVDDVRFPWTRLFEIDLDLSAASGGLLVKERSA